MKEIDNLNRLKSLLNSGAIDSSEFEKLKKQIIEEKEYSTSEGNIPQDSIIASDDRSSSKQTKEEGNDFTVYLFKITIALALLMSVIIWIRYDNILFFLLLLTLSILSPFIIAQKVYRLKFRNLLLFSLIPLFIFVIAVPIGNTVKYESDNSSSGTYLYCKKHDQAYNTQNAWKGCPDCAEEEWDSKVEESRQRMIDKYDN